MPVYRYKFSGVSSALLARGVPGSLVVGSSSPFYLDVTATVGAKSDLDEYMGQQGFSYSSQDPTSSPTVQGATESQQGMSFKQPVRVASTANVSALSGLLTIDGVTLVAGDRVLLKDQTAGANNGIYVAAAGAWSRASDFDSSDEVKGGTLIAVSEGPTNGNLLWILTTDDPITVGTTALTFVQIGATTSPNSRWKDPCRVTTDTNLPALSGLLTIGGIALSSGDRVLVKNQTAGSANGIYVAAAGAWTRATDANDGTKLGAGTIVYVNAGAPGGDGLYSLTTNDPIVVGTTALSFELLSGDGGGLYQTKFAGLVVDTSMSSSSFANLLTFTLTKKRSVSNIKVSATCGFKGSTSSLVASFRLVVDGVVQCGCSQGIEQDNGTGVAALSTLVSGLGPGTYTITLQWKRSTGTLSINPVTALDSQHASLFAEEVG
jgi:hypothetical protein